MKNYCTLILAIFWLTDASSQCFDPEAVDWNLDGSYLLTIKALDDGTVYYPDGSTQAVLNGDLLYYTGGTTEQFNTLSWLLLPTGGGACMYDFDVNTATFIDTYHISTTPPPICGGTDESICVDLPGYNPVAFSIPGGTSSTNGCITGLIPNSYPLTFTDFTDDGITYSNPTRDPKIFTLEVELIDVSGTLEGQAAGGSGNYGFSYQSGDGWALSYVNYEAGCFHVTGVDNVSGCSANNISYYSPTLAGDLGEADGCVNADDLLAFLSDLGLGYDVLEGNLSTQCDFNCDGLVNVADLLFLLSVFGECG